MLLWTVLYCVFWWVVHCLTRGVGRLYSLLGSVQGPLLLVFVPVSVSLPLLVPAVVAAVVVVVVVRPVLAGLLQGVVPQVDLLVALWSHSGG